jgi:hypothetical protein
MLVSTIRFRLGRIEVNPRPAARNRYSGERQTNPSALPRLGNRWIFGPYFAAAVEIHAGSKHDERMGTRAHSSTPDLFSSTPAREAHSQPSEPIGSPNAVPSRHVLPADLANAVRHLDDHELDRLLSAVIAEQKRRGSKSPAEISRKQRVDVVAAVPLTQGKLNAVRAAFKAGVTPSRIARQFGISQSDVRKALASENAKR